MLAITKIQCYGSWNPNLFEFIIILMVCIDMFLQVGSFCEQNDSIQTVLQIRAQGSVPARPVQI